MMDDELIKFCRINRLLNNRDTDKTVVRVFRIVLKVKDVGSSEIEKMSGIKRLTARHHLERLKECGLLIERKGRYYLKFNSIEDYIEYRRRKMIRMFEELEQMAESIDREYYEEDE